jgi:hypothetical protein
MEHDGPQRALILRQGDFLPALPGAIRLRSKSSTFNENHPHGLCVTIHIQCIKRIV